MVNHRNIILAQDEGTSNAKAIAIDAWLSWHVTGGQSFDCDYSNAARTQLFNLASGE